MRVCKARAQIGITLVDTLISMSISIVILSGLFIQFADTTALSYDQTVKQVTDLNAQAVLQTIGAELRILGNGVPFDQANFQIGEDPLYLSDPSKADPIIVSTSDLNRIDFRLNEDGRVYILTADFDPSVSLTASMTDVTGLATNDEIFINNSTVAEDDGFYGVISTVNSISNTVTFDSSNIVYSPSAIFEMGSTAEEVPIVTIESKSDGSAIVRDAGYGELTLAPNATMSITYLDFNENAIALPLDANILINQLRSIQVTISIQSSKPLRSGESYTASSTQVFGLRNFNYVF